MRVFLGPCEVAGVYRGLKEGFDRLGVPCAFFNLYNHKGRYGGEVADPLVTLARWGESGSRFRRGVGRGARVARFVDVIRSFDVFIFGFGTSFTGVLREIALLKSLGKKVIFQFHGSDSRPAYLDGSVMAADRGMSIEDAIARTRRQARRLELIGRYADVVVDIPPTGQLHRRPFVNWLRVGLPSRPRWFPARVSPRAADDGRVRVLHAPSHPLAKGSPQIRAIVAGLTARGLPVDLVEVTNRPNEEVLHELERCDIVIDQMFSDYPMPTFACEAAWFGRPVVLGGYAVDGWRRWLPPDELPPTFYVHPNDVGDELERLVRDRTHRVEAGARARAFVESRWAPEHVAERYLRLAAGDIPVEWLVDPRNIRHHGGACHDDQAGTDLLGRYIARGGRRSLCVPHNPALEQLMVDRGAQRATSAVGSQQRGAS